MSTISSVQSIENKRDIYKGKNYMKNFCESLREHTLKKKKKCKVRDQCYYTGEYRSAAYSICNLNMVS